MLPDGNPYKKVQRLTVEDGSVFYLKQIGREPSKHHLRTLFCGHIPYSRALRELRMLKKLRSAGFITMEPVAWGERRCFGVPLDGFLVVREVRGEEVSELYKRSSGLEKRILLETVGRLVGQLHAKGFFQPVRLKDLILTEAGLVLIDRETSKPWKSFFLRKKCINSLLRSIRRTLRDGYHIGIGGTAAFLKGYRMGISSRWAVSSSTLLKKLFSKARN